MFQLLLQRSGPGVEFDMSGFAKRNLVLPIQHPALSPALLQVSYCSITFATKSKS